MVARAGIQFEELGASLGHQVFTSDRSFCCALSWLNLSQASPYYRPLTFCLPQLWVNTTQYGICPSPHQLLLKIDHSRTLSYQSPLIISLSVSSFLSKDLAYVCLPYSEGLLYKRKPFFCLISRCLQISAIRAFSLLWQVFLLNKASPYQSLDLFLFDTRFLNPSFICHKGKKKEKNGLSGAIPVCDLWKPKFSWSISNFRRKRHVHFRELDRVIFFKVHNWSTFFTLAWKCFSAHPVWIFTKWYPTLFCVEWQDVIYTDSFLSRSSGSLHSGLCESQLGSPGRAGPGNVLSSRRRVSVSHALHN